MRFNVKRCVLAFTALYSLFMSQSSKETYNIMLRAREAANLLYYAKLELEKCDEKKRVQKAVIELNLSWNDRPRLLSPERKRYTTIKHNQCMVLGDS